MAFMNFLDKWFPTKRSVGSDVVTVDVPVELYYKEMALYNGISIIADAIAKIEINTIENGKKVYGKDYYLLNISPNPNETSSAFWRKVIERAIRRDDGAYAFEHAGNLYCADTISIEEENSLHGHIYSGITVGNYMIDRKIDAEHIYHFKMRDVGIDRIMNGIGEEYGNLIKSASAAFKKSNGKRYRLKIDSIQAGDAKFMEQFETRIKKQLETYLKSEFAVYPEFEGTELINDGETTVRNADDIIKLRKDIFEMTANMLHIPLTLMTGTTNNMNEIIKIFLTFCIDPYCDMISEVLNKRGGYFYYSNNSKYAVDTTKIAHRDIFDISEKIDKLLSSGIMCIDEIREKIGMESLDTEWSKQHWMTKNYHNIEEALEQIGE